MGCTQSVTDAQSNPQDPFDNKDETTTPVKRSTSLPLPRSSSSPYRINKKHSSSNNSQSPNKRMIVARAKIKRLGSGSWTSDRKNKIRGLGRDRLKKRARNNNEDVKLSNPTDPTDFLGIVSKNDFIMDSYAIGKGSFGFVVLGKHKRNNITYALKQTRKVDVIKKKGTAHLAKINT